MLTTRAKYLLSVKRLTIRNELIPKHNVDKKRIILELLSTENPKVNKICEN